MNERQRIIIKLALQYFASHLDDAIELHGFCDEDRSERLAGVVPPTDEEVDELLNDFQDVL